jgi:hypothetical protein
LSSYNGNAGDANGAVLLFTFQTVRCCFSLFKRCHFSNDF